MDYLWGNRAPEPKGPPNVTCSLYSNLFKVIYLGFAHLKVQYKLTGPAFSTNPVIISCYGHPLIFQMYKISSNHSQIYNLFEKYCLLYKYSPVDYRISYCWCKVHLFLIIMLLFGSVSIKYQCMCVVFR